MADTPAEQLNSQNGELPPAEELKPKTGFTQPASTTTQNPALVAAPFTKKRRRGSYRPSHKATFIALSVVGIILVINAVVLTFVLKHKATPNNLGNQAVTISSSTLNKLGVNDTAVGDSGIQLTVGPSAHFNGSLTVAGTTNISGQLTLNSTLSATTANITQLQAGNTTVSQLDVNGNATATNLNLRSGLVVAGTSQFQGPVTTNQLVSINNNLNVGGNLVVGGALEATTFEITNLSINGHVTTTGLLPSVTAGPAIGTYGTVSSSGNDEAGTINVNTGGGASSGTVVSLVFHTAYSTMPRVVVTPIGAPLVIGINRSESGFTITVSSLTPLASSADYDFDYIVEQ